MRKWRVMPGELHLDHCVAGHERRPHEEGWPVALMFSLDMNERRPERWSRQPRPRSGDGYRDEELRPSRCL